MKKQVDPLDHFFKAVGQNIKKERERKGYILAYVSENAGISIGNIADIENGKNKNPTLYTLKKIADCLDVPVSKFFHGL